MKSRIVTELLACLSISAMVATGAFAQTRNPSQKTLSRSKLEIKPLNVKPGLWETTATYKRSGAPPIPAEALAKLTPAQRARLEERMNAHAAGSTNTVTDKHCVTKEDVEKADFGEGKGDCTYKVETSTSTQAKGTYSCNIEGMEANGSVDIKAPDSEHIVGSTQGSLNGGGRTMNLESTFSSKFVSASCGNTK